MENTGFKKWDVLEEYDVETGEPTGNTKPNVEGEPDYVPPRFDRSSCPTDREDPWFIIYPYLHSITSSSFTSKWLFNLDIVVSCRIIYKKIDDADWSEILTFGLPSQARITQLQPNTEYLFLVMAYNADGEAQGGWLKKYRTDKDPDHIPLYEKPLYMTVSSGIDACQNWSLAASDIYFTDNTNLSLATVIYSDSSGTVNAPKGHYSDGLYRAYWNGNIFFNKDTCGIDDTIDPIE